ncbi:hypothetical protein D3C87_1090940 [compost metagenome]
MSMQREPEVRVPREGSEEYFSEKVHETPAAPPASAEEAYLPPPQDMGEDG